MFDLAFRDLGNPVVETAKKPLKTLKQWLEANTPPCPKCGSPLVLRTAKTGPNAGNQFYGCSNYPRCNGTMGYKMPQNQLPSQSAQQIQQPHEWIYAQSINDSFVPKNTKIAVAKVANGWSYVVLTPGILPTKGLITAPDIKNIIQSIRTPDGKPLKTQNPSLQDLNSQLNGSTQGESKKKSPMIPDELMSDEQKAIDAKFEKLIQSPNQSHIMISALAGSGKTSMLKHLAWKYGSPNQKWLYLVFNTKNKVEAADEFPRFVQVRTTNGFLGEVLKDRPNVSRFPQTDRIIDLSNYRGAGEDSSRLEKARILIDGDGFVEFLSRMGMPTQQVQSFEYGKMAKNLNSLLKSIRYELKEQILKLAGLAKSFALDPRNMQALDQGIKKILDSYDIDTELSEVKERIAGYKNENYRDEITSSLRDIFGYDFMDKDFTDEIVKGTKWLLNETMPHATTAKYRQGTKDHNLGQYRDFSDDLWYAASHAEQLQWPHYDVVLADEVQDFNEAQKIMLKKLHEAGAKIVAVGDVSQSLYRFRGADGKAFGNISNQLKDLSHDKDIVSSLSSNFRSRKNIIDFVNQETHVKNLKQGKKFADGGEGNVTKGDIKYDNAFEELGKEKADGNIKETAFISRTNEPLVHAALKLLAQGVPFVVVGKDIAKDLKKHIGKIIAKFNLRDDDSTRELSESLTGFRDDELENHEGKSTKKAYLSELSEVTEALISSLGHFEEENNQRDTTIGQFKVWLSQKLGGLDVEESEKDYKEYKARMEREKPVVLTTAHRSKGLEFDRVYVLRYDQFPHKKAQRPEDIEQEENARYVALSRAKDELHILDLEGQPGYKK